MTLMTKVALLALLCFLPLHSQLRKIYVTINHTGTDRVGDRFVYYLKEVISKSSRYSLDTSAIDINNLQFIDISVVSTRIDETGNSSAIAVVSQKLQNKCTAPFLTQVLVVGNSKSEESAKDAFASIDDAFAK